MMGYSLSVGFSSFVAACSDRATSISCLAQSEKDIPASFAAAKYIASLSSVTRTLGMRLLAVLPSFGGLPILFNVISITTSIHKYLQAHKCLVSSIDFTRYRRTIVGRLTRNPTSPLTLIKTLTCNEAQAMTDSKHTTPPAPAESEKFDTKHKSTSDKPKFQPVTVSQRKNILAYVLQYQSEFGAAS